MEKYTPLYEKARNKIKSAPMETISDTGVISERSRASKTLTVKQEIPSSNPGDFSMFDFQFLIFYNKQLKLFYLSGSLRNTQLSYLYFFTASVLHIHSLFIMYDVTNIKGYALKQVSKDPAGFKPTNSGS